MIKVTKFDGSMIYINPHLLEVIEKKPDTTLTYKGQKIIVKDSIDEIILRIVAYRKSIGISIGDVE